MAQAGVSVELNLAAELMRATAAIQATPAQIEKASQRALKKTLRWVQTQIAREVSRVLNVPQKVLKPRLQVTSVGSGPEQVHILWFGVAPLGAEKIGNPRQTKAGISVGKYRFAGAFHQNIYGDGAAVWIRKARAQALGLDLPNWSGRSTGGESSFIASSQNRGRFPVRRVGIEVETPVAELFRRYDRRVLDRFSTLIEQELNYVVNHER